MDDVGVGRVFRALRLRSHWRQSDLAARAGCSQALVAQLEAGRLDATTLRTVRAVGAPLGLRFELAPRWRGADLERILDEAHAELVAHIAAHLERAGWSVRLEVTYSEYGERGSIDVLASLPAARASLVVEAKTAFGSAEAVGRKLDEKARLGPRIVERLEGWRPAVTGRALVMPDTARLRRTFAATPVLARMLPAGSREIRAWLKGPASPISAAWFLSNITPGNQMRAQSKRIRLRHLARHPAAVNPSGTTATKPSDGHLTVGKPALDYPG
jgi:transcriptional regulator with XRE-family HTH domain